MSDLPIAHRAGSARAILRYSDTTAKDRIMTADLDAILGEIDRQLLDIRAAADGIATRAGLLFAAAGVAAAVLAPAVQPGHVRVLLIAALAVLAASLLAGVLAVMPWLQLGLGASWLTSALGHPTRRTTSMLHDGKAIILAGNYDRLRNMRVAFTVQAFATIIAAGLALSYAAWK
jgi:hypothetical protein